MNIFSIFWKPPEQVTVADALINGAVLGFALVGFIHWITTF